jgi:putative transposase
MPGLSRRASGTTRGPSRYFIPGTNSIESLNYQLRKIIKNRGHFPNDDAVAKLLWLAIRDIEAKRAAERAKEAGLAKSPSRRRAAAVKMQRPTGRTILTAPSTGTP